MVASLSVGFRPLPQTTPEMSLRPRRGLYIDAFRGEPARGEVPYLGIRLCHRRASQKPRRISSGKPGP
jgi:hypothetical protein